MARQAVCAFLQTKIHNTITKKESSRISSYPHEYIFNSVIMVSLVWRNSKVFYAILKISSTDKNYKTNVVTK